MTRTLQRQRGLIMSVALASMMCGALIVEQVVMAPISGTGSTRQSRFKRDESGDKSQLLKALDHMKKFGYINETSSSSLISDDQASEYIKSYQNTYGLEETGTLDDETQKLMEAPRCGMKDIGGGRMGEVWPTNRDITYKITSYLANYKGGERRQRNEIRAAFGTWEKVSPLRFKFVDPDQKADMEIYFGPSQNRQGRCTDNFDGENGVLAHATYPQFGHLHFDEAENWNSNNNMLYKVAVHEIGHAIGIEHITKVRGAIMFPTYEPSDAPFKLHSADIREVQNLYPNPPNRPKPRPDDGGGEGGEGGGDGNGPTFCDRSMIDALISAGNGNRYILKGAHYWILDQNHALSEPRTIRSKWAALPNNIDAAFTTDDGKTYFFKGDQYWRYTGNKLDKQKSISSTFAGIPNNIDAAFQWDRNNKIYFFKGDQYWAYIVGAEQPISDHYPRRISYWRGIKANKIDTVIQYSSGKTFFFEGKRFWRINHKGFVDDSGNQYPKPIDAFYNWIGCGNSKLTSDDDTTQSSVENEVNELTAADEAASVDEVVSSQDEP